MPAKQPGVLQKNVKVAAAASPERIRRQNAAAKAAARQQAFRARAKAKSEEQKAAATAAREFAAHELGAYRYRNYRSIDTIEWVVRVGCAPSAAGARSPLAGIVTGVTCRATNRWSVELYRWRMCAYSLLCERDLLRTLYESDCFGLKVNFDETPTRIFCAVEDKATDVSVQVRCVSVYGSEGLVRTMTPQLRRCAGSSAADLFAALNLESLDIGALCASPTEWRFILVVPDSARANSVVARHLVYSQRERERLLIVFASCFAHVLSNCTKWSMGAKFGYGSFLRLSHILQARGFNFKQAHVICSDKLERDPAVLDEALVARGRRVWDIELGFFFAKNGPYSGSTRGDFFRERLDTCHSLWPLGPPHATSQWRHVDGKQPADYVQAMLMLFRRTIATPVASRWYSVESFAWFLLLGRNFGVLESCVCRAAPLSYWPGDNPMCSAEDAPGVAAQSRDRMNRAAAYVRSSEFVHDIYIATVGCIPRWHFARSLVSNASSGNDGVGVSRACVAFLNSVMEILAGRNEVVEHMLAAEDSEAELRLSCYAALGRSVLYLSEKNLPYCSPIWRILRGEASADTIVDALADTSSVCCEETGLMRKIRASLDPLGDMSRLASIVNLIGALNACSTAYTGSDGCHNLAAESAFSDLRFLGAKLPYRPMKLSTAQRELVLKYVRACHKEWFARYVQREYGTLRNMYTSHSKVLSKSNGFSAFCRSMCVPFSRGRIMWNMVGAAEKTKWGEIAAALNDKEASAHKARDDARVSRASCGPFGSTRRWVPVSVAEVADRLDGADGSLRAAWSKSGSRAFRDDFDRVPYPPQCSAADSDGVRRVLLPGESCGRCREAVKDRSVVYYDLYDTLARQFVAVGSHTGLTLALEYNEGVDFWEFALLIRNPRRLLALPIRVLEYHEEYLPGVGNLPSDISFSVRDVFDGHSCCLLNLFARRGRPLGIWVFEKRGVVMSAAAGWVCQLFPRATVLDLDMDMGAAPARGLPRQRPPAPPRCEGFGLEEFARMFGESADADDPPREEPPEPDVSPRSNSGESCEEVEDAGRGELQADGFRDGGPDLLVAGVAAENIAQRVAVADQRLFTTMVSRVVDTRRYAVTVRIETGVFTVYWKAAEKSRHWDAFVAACQGVRSIAGARELTSSKSSTLSKHAMDGCLDRARAWQQWHTCWVYKIRPTCDLLSRMPLPPGPLLDAHPICDDISSASDDSGKSSSRQSERSAAEDASTSSMGETSLGTEYSDGPASSAVHRVA